MKRSMMALVLLFVGMLFLAACGDGGKTCSPACATGTVCIAEGGTPSCKKSCEKDEDCEKGQECHKDEGPAHCDAAD